MMDSGRNLDEIGVMILAAGLSTRMGRPKMLMTWQESTVIQSVVRSYLSAGLKEILVITGGSRKEIEGLLKELPVRLVFNPKFENGEMLDSLKIGINSFSTNIRAAMIALGDQPRIESKVISKVIDGYLNTNSRLIVPSFKMRRGHPWIVEKSLWGGLLNLELPDTLREFLKDNSEEIQYIDIQNSSILMDMDTPEDYERLKNEE
jgi:molybdenum cofactor cytidylyltransferase